MDPIESTSTPSMIILRIVFIFIVFKQRFIFDLKRVAGGSCIIIILIVRIPKSPFLFQIYLDSITNKPICQALTEDRPRQKSGLKNKAILTFGVEFFVHVSQLFVGDMGINLGGGDVGMTKHYLNGTNISTIGKQISGKAVSNDVRSHFLGYSCL